MLDYFKSPAGELGRKAGGEFTIRKPDDWHVHFRDGDILEQVAGFTAAHFARAIIMPNLVPPVTTTAQAVAYRERILACLRDYRFTPLMTCYLTDATDVADMISGFKAGVFTAAKLYPAHATTNSASGVSDVRKIDPVLAAMAEHGMPLLMHGELPRPDIDVFDREKAFIDAILLPLLERIPKLRIVMEHITTADGVAVVSANPQRLGATITPQHLLYNRNALFAGGLRPHMYCLPVLKREEHRLALRAAATSGEANFFIGTDSAPHLKSLKESACGCAGIFGAPAALAAYLNVFDEENALDRFERFASINGATFYGLPLNEDRLTIRRQPATICEAVDVAGAGEILPLLSGEAVNWSFS